MTKNHILIVGGGLGGLLSADLLLDAGFAVTVFERSASLGGLAQTDRHGTFALNRGPRALYKVGAMRRLLRERGVAISGRQAPTRGAYGAVGGAEVPLSPRGAMAGAGARFLDVVARMLAGPPDAVRDVSIAEFVEQRARGNRRAADLLHALVRVTTYCADDALSAEVALRQVRAGLRGVLYLDGGWAPLISALREKVLAKGGVIRSGTPVEQLVIDADGVRVSTREGAAEGAAVVLACSRRGADVLLGGALSPARPAVVSCLDVALAKTRPDLPGFVLGIDEATYLSVHSRTAALAPDDGEVVHVMGYGGAPREVLERCLDRWDANWRARGVHVRYLPRMEATAHLPTADEAGLSGRAPVDHGPRVQLVGDWAGAEGFLADAVAASVRAACKHIVRRFSRGVGLAAA